MEIQNEPSQASVARWSVGTGRSTRASQVIASEPEDIQNGDASLMQVNHGSTRRRYEDRENYEALVASVSCEKMDIKSFGFHGREKLC